jgi:tetratricopeptide (TPR) repeat protein
MLDRLRLVQTRQIASILLLVLGPWKLAAADEERDAARSHYARGLDLAAHGGYEAALQEFNEAYAISPQFAVLYNIGQAQVALGHPMEAIETFSEYLQDSQDRVPRTRRQQVKALIAFLESRLGELSVTTDRPNARVSVDGRVVGSTPLRKPIRVAPGTHKISAALEGAPSLVRIVTVGEAEHQTVALELPAPSAKAAAEAARAAVAEAVAAAAAATRAAAAAEAAARVATAVALSSAEREKSETATRASSAAAARAATAAAAAAAAEIMAHVRATPGGGGR